MRTISVATALLMLSQISAAPVPKEDPTKAELSKLDGTWQVTSFKMKGIELIDKLPQEQLLITFKNGEFSWANEGGASGKIVVIDPSKTPKEVDYTYTEGEDKGKTSKAIYKLDGDTFTDCFGPAGSARPKEFTSTDENDQMVLVYKRVKKDK
jgi:uncharacterized protein (TIGR03067 family)